MRLPVLFSAMLLTTAVPAVVSAQVTGAETHWCGGYGQPHPDMPEEFGQFAFIIGDFEVGSRPWDAEAGEWGEALYTARWNGRYGLGGRAIIDEWYDPGYGYRPESGAGINTRIWDEAEGVWKTAWIHTGTLQTMELHQRLDEDGKLWLWQVYPETGERRVYFERYDADHWARIDMVFDEESGAWINRFMLDANRVDCSAVE
jgi:hypothetical protein